MRVFCSVIVATLLLGGCSDLYEPKPHVTSLKDDAVLSSTASITNTFILDRKRRPTPPSIRPKKATCPSP